MGHALSSFCRGLYAVVLGLNMLLAVGLMRLVHLLPISAQTREGWSLMFVWGAWRLTFLLTPWVWCTAAPDYGDVWRQTLGALEEAKEEAAKNGKQAPPLFVLGNHTSFFDSVLSASHFPPSVLWRSRTYMDHALFKLPVISSLCYCVGHFPVYFKSGEDGIFKVDVERMEEVEQKVNRHLDNGGALCFFPEGQVNKNPDVLMPFRYGGIKKALAYDARLMFFVGCGNDKVWPKKALVGGFPGRVRYSTKLMAPKGCKALAEELRKKAKPEEKDLPDYELLARYLHDAMQEQYDELRLALAGPQGSKKAD